MVTSLLPGDTLSPGASSKDPVEGPVRDRPRSGRRESSLRQLL